MDKAHDGHGVANQLAKLEQKARQRGWTVVYRLSVNDIGVTRKDPTRPGKVSEVAFRGVVDRVRTILTELVAELRVAQPNEQADRGCHTRRHATARQAPIPPLVRHRKPCGSRAGTGHNLTKRAGVPASRHRLASDGASWLACQK